MLTAGLRASSPLGSQASLLLEFQTEAVMWVMYMKAVIRSNPLARFLYSKFVSLSVDWKLVNLDYQDRATS